VLKKILSISLTLILLLSNVGFTYGTHFCMGMAVKSEVMLGHEHLDCGMGMMDMDTHSEGMHFSESECCDNQYVTAETDNQFKPDVSVTGGDLMTTAAFAFILYHVVVVPAAEQTFILDTSPPLPDQEIFLLNQVFRI